MRKLWSILAVLLASLLTLSMVSALDTSNLAWGTVKVNGDLVNDGDSIAVEEGKTLDIRVGLVGGTTGASDIEVEAYIAGYEYSDYEDLGDATSLFDVAAGTTKYVTLSVNLPKKLDKETYWLRLRVLDQNSPALEKNIMLAVEPTDSGLDIADVVVSPGTTVKAGKSLLATVLLQNYGDKDQTDVKVTVSIPELGVTASEFVDVVATDNSNIDYEDVPEMFLPIPATAKEGDYEVKVTAKYDEYETVSKSFTIKVIGNELFQQVEKLVLAVGPEKQTVAAGSTATYAVALTNAGSTSKAFLLEATAGSDWATTSLSESLVVLEPGKNQVVYVDVATSPSATTGDHTASVALKSANGELLQSVAFQANVVAGTDSASAGNVSLRNGLEIALIVLVVVLIVIGLIIGFSRMKKDDEEEKTYY